MSPYGHTVIYINRPRPKMAPRMSKITMTTMIVYSIIYPSFGIM